MKKLIFNLTLVLLALGGLASCQESDDTWDPYYRWKARNTEWFAQVADTARTAIAKAKALHGEQWEDFCDWRMYRGLLRSQEGTGVLTDSICCRIIRRGTGSFSPAFTDTVRVSFRGWLMETEYTSENGGLEPGKSVFSQTYYGDFDEATAAPQVMSVAGLTEGFGTAVQYMVKGDEWLVYIPNELAYKEKDSQAVPAYSTLLFHLHLAAIYEAGEGVPEWKAKKKK